MPYHYSLRRLSTNELAHHYPTSPRHLAFGLLITSYTGLLCSWPHRPLLCSVCLKPDLRLSLYSWGNVFLRRCISRRSRYGSNKNPTSGQEMSGQANVKPKALHNLTSVLPFHMLLPRSPLHDLRACWLGSAAHPRHSLTFWPLYHLLFVVLCLLTLNLFLHSL